ncbi:hypothetical protein R1flu_013848 [Riccia fluitans]|uniref:Uncharacterized protein n=1 Tax=Riccia fluitans TaxID=41844 RepID=A0ABD1YEJ9_9MARC
MRYSSFLILIEHLQPFVEKGGPWAAIPIQLAVAAVLHRLAYGLPPKIVAAAYGIGTSTVVVSEPGGVYRALPRLCFPSPAPVPFFFEDIPVRLRGRCA